MAELLTTEGPLTVARMVPAPRVQVWQQIANEEMRKVWWPGLEIELRSGGSVRQKVRRKGVKRTVVGDIDVFAEGHALGFVWRDHADHHTTSVLIALLSEDKETKLVITEVGFEAFPNPEERSHRSIRAWNARLDDLVALIQRA